MTRGSPEGRRLRGYLQLVLVVAVVVAGIYFARAPERMAIDPGDPLGRTAGPPLVTVVEPEASAHSASVTLTGSVGPHGLVTMLPSVAGGRVIWVSPALRFGGAFSAGEVLLRIDPIDYQMAVEDGHAEVKGAEARLWKHQLEGERDSARYLRQNPGATEVPPLIARIPQIERAQALLDERRVALSGRELSLSRTEFSLPFDGRVARSQVAVGQVLAGGTAFGTAYARDAMEVGAGIGHEDLAYLEPAIGRTAIMVSEDQIFTGEVVRVASTIDPASRLTRLFLKFADDIPLESLPLPGSFVTVNIEGPAFEDSFLLPNAAEQPGGHIWVVRNGQLESMTPLILRQAVTGWLDSPGWLVRAFDAGDGVVVGTVFGAHDGMRVRIEG